MNQTQRLIDSIRDAPHDAVIVAGMFAIPALIALWIVNRMRHQLTSPGCPEAGGIAGVEGCRINTPGSVE